MLLCRYHVMSKELLRRMSQRTQMGEGRMEAKGSKKQKKRGSDNHNRVGKKVGGWAGRHGMVGWQVGEGEGWKAWCVCGVCKGKTQGRCVASFLLSPPLSGTEQTNCPCLMCFSHAMSAMPISCPCHCHPVLPPCPCPSSQNSIQASRSSPSCPSPPPMSCYACHHSIAWGGRKGMR